MMTMGKCLSDQQLRDFAMGYLDESELESAAQHLESCPFCEVVMERFDREDNGLLKTLAEPDVNELHLAESGFQRTVKELSCFPAINMEYDQETQLGQYQLAEQLGRGGMGTVYKGIHVRLQKSFAIKVMRNPPDLLGRSTARFEREMRAVGQLQHKHIVQASDAGDWNGHPFLVMEFLDGLDLGRILRSLGPLGIANACEIVRQAGTGLQHAHQHQLIHRDLKPSNLMVTIDGTVKLLDLGLARWLGEAEDNTASTEVSEKGLTESGNVLGTVDYMAPEQAADSTAVDVRSDLYSLGCTLYAALLGTSPREIGPRSWTADLESRSDVPKKLRDLIVSLLDECPASRPANAAEVVDQLTPFCRGADLEALVAQCKDKPGEPPASKAPQATIPARKWWVIALLLFATVASVASIITIKTPYGSIEVETEHDDVQVVVLQGGKEVKVADAQTGWSIRVRAGQYELDLKGTSDKFQLERETVTVTRGKVQIVKVRLKPANNKKERTAPNPRPKKRASSTARKPNESPVAYLTRLGATLRKENGRISSMIFAHSQVTDEDLELLLKDDFAHLKELSLIHCTRITDDSLKHVGKLKKLEQLNLSPSSITSEGIPHILSLRGLRVLSLNGTQVSDSNLELLAKLPELRVLYLNGTRISDEGLGNLRNLKMLSWLDLGRTRVTDAGMADLAQLRNLKQLHLSDIRISDRGAIRLGELSSLEQLDLRRTSITDAALESLGRIKSLRQLDIRETQITPIGLVAFSRSVPHCKILAQATMPSRVPRVSLPFDWKPPAPKLEGLMDTLCAVFHGDELITGGMNGTIYVWDFSTGKLKRSCRPTSYYVRNLAVSPDGTLTASVSRNQFVSICRNDRVRPIQQVKGGSNYLVAVDYAPDGRQLATGGKDNMVVLYRVSPFKVHHRLKGHTNHINDVVYSPDGKTLASCSKDGSIKLWDPSTGKIIRTIQARKSELTSIDFDSTGKRIVSAGAGRDIRIWNVDTGERLLNIPTPQPVIDLDVSPTDQLIASCSSNGMIRICEMNTGKLVKTLGGNGKKAIGVVFAPDGTKLVSVGGKGGKLRFYDIPDFSHYGSAEPLKRWSTQLASPGNVHIEMKNGNVVSVQLGGGEITDRGIELLAPLKDITQLKLTYTYGCTAKSLRHLSDLKKLKVLNLWGNYNFTDGVMQLKELVNIEDLCLHKLQVTDANMAFVDRMKKCRRFQMTLNRAVTDEGIKHLTRLTELEYIYLTCPQLTDNALASLSELTRLENATISSPLISQEALTEFARRLPRLKVLNGEPVERK